MPHSPYNPLEWRKHIPNIDAVMRQLDRTPILSVGITPYSRVIPALFLRNYAIYTIQRSSDADIIEEMFPIHVLEDTHPKIARRVHGTGYLTGNFAFQNFLRSLPSKPLLFLSNVTDKIIRDLGQLGVGYIGNGPDTMRGVGLKQDFKALVKELGLPALPVHTYSREAFLSASFASLQQEAGGAFVIQRGDKETGCNEGTFFIHAEADLKRCQEVLAADETFTTIVCTRFVDGHSTSMLGCVMPQGTLSGPLQLQFIDVPASLHGVEPNGIFFGNDIGFCDWDASAEAGAQQAVEAIGKHLQAQGYRGIFGLDFLYDKASGEIFAIECNPRFTGSLTLTSLMLLEQGLPPLEFFHLLAHLDIEAEFDFDRMNSALKTRLDCAHIAFSPRGIRTMELSFPAGVYRYAPTEETTLEYMRPGLSLADIQHEDEFLVIDTVPRLHGAIEQQVPRLFKLIFPRSIARSSHAVDEAAATLLGVFSEALLRAAEQAGSQHATQTAQGSDPETTS